MNTEIVTRFVQKKIEMKIRFVQAQFYMFFVSIENVCVYFDDNRDIR